MWSFNSIQWLIRHPIRFISGVSTRKHACRMHSKCLKTGSTNLMYQIESSFQSPPLLNQWFALTNKCIRADFWDSYLLNNRLCSWCLTRERTVFLTNCFQNRAILVGVLSVMKTDRYLFLFPWRAWIKRFLICFVVVIYSSAEPLNINV